MPSGSSIRTSPSNATARWTSACTRHRSPGASASTAYNGPTHSVTRSPVSSSTSRVSPSSSDSPSATSITPPGGLQSSAPLRRRFWTSSKPSSLSMSPPPTVQSRTCPVLREHRRMHPTVARVVEAAAAHGLEIEPREFPDGTRTAQDAAQAIGVEVGQIVKSLAFKADGEIILVLVSGSNRLDEDKLAAATGASTIERADADAVRAAT